ncbi:MAG: sensor histidine kinase [Phycisphaerales bacterium]|nr:MAG: sensor histidine kinase [Phycisphaerales bacterium]
MPTSGASSASVLHSVSPFRVFVLILATVFTVEFIIMLFISMLPEDAQNSLWVSLLDSTLLTAALCPALWLLVVRPLRALVAERGDLLSRAFSIQEDERARVARDLHDELGQAQAVLLLGLRAISRAETLTDARERAEWLLEPATNAMDSTRRLARGLSPAILSDFGLAIAIPRLCEDIAHATEISIESDVSIGDRRYTTPMEIACYRVVQEAITNAAKHSGARTIRVVLEQAVDRLRVRVSDDGRGLPRGTEYTESPSGRGLGLSGMRERVVLLGGDFRMTSNPGRGTTVEASFPIGVHNP